MTLCQLILRSLRYYWRSGLAILAGIVVATAVITGSLLVGDSVNGSVRDTALARLGVIQQALLAPSFFRQGLADEIGKDVGAPASIVPLIIAQGTAQPANSQISVPNVNAIGIDANFWRCYPGTTVPAVNERAAAVNYALAHDLHLSTGDYLLLTLARQGDAPASSLFARRTREDTTRTLRVQIVAILPDNGAGGFALQASTTTPRNIFIARDWLAARLDHPAQVNALLVTGSERQTIALGALQQALAAHCRLDDYGLALDDAPVISTTPAVNTGRSASTPTGNHLVSAAVNLHSGGVVMNEATTRAAIAAAAQCGAHAEVASVYLATSIKRGATPARDIAYAILAGVAPTTTFPLSAGNQLVDDDGILLNEWAATDLNAQVGDRLTLSYLTPSWEGVYRATQREFTLRGIVTLSGAAAEAGLAPNFEGISGVERIEDWNPPFPIDITRVTARDENYWTQYRTMPKAFISQPALRDMWQQGEAGRQADWLTTVSLFPPAGAELLVWKKIFSATFLRTISPRDAGFFFLPVRQQALASSESPTDFGQLFLAMSFFLLLSAVGMAGMLMRLMIERRASTIGIMQACGLPPTAVFRAMLGEGVTISVIGSLIGAPCGLLYARELISLLATRWSALIGTATLWLHVSASSLLIGVLVGVLAGLCATAWGTWRSLRKGNVLVLLAGGEGADLLENVSTPTSVFAYAKIACWGMALLIIAAAGCIIPASLRKGFSPALAFFLAGFLLLLAGLWLCQLLLYYAGRGRALAPSWWWFALRNAAAHRKRSLLTIGLLAGASFLLVTVAAHSRDFGQIDMANKNSGTGGFTLRAISSMPINYDFGSQSGRRQLGFSDGDEASFSQTRVIPFLMSSGGDISCLNITRPPTPRVLGVPPEMIERGGFTVETAHKTSVPWHLLQTPLADGCIPTFGDADSVRWTLHSDLGQVYTINDAAGRAIRLRFVGLLSGSIFAGELLIARDNFTALYPAVSAPRLFLLDTPASQISAVTDSLRANMSDLGLEVISTKELLLHYLSVQQTYLSTFLTLGGLGLLLGVLGMVAAVLHSAFDRRKEFALLSAIGFRRSTLSRVLLLEYVSLLLSGVLCGALAALVASIPQMLAPDTPINWLTVTLLLGGMIVLGAIACALAGWYAIGDKLLDGLRSE